MLLLFFNTLVGVKSQIIEEISIDSNEFTQLSTYLNEIGVTKKNRYLIIYDLNECLYCDHHFIDQLLNLETTFKNLTFVLLLDESKEKSLISSPNFERDYVYIDEKQLFKKQSFYSYHSIIYVIENDQILAKYPVTGMNAYGLKYHLFQKGSQ